MKAASMKTKSASIRLVLICSLRAESRPLLTHGAAEAASLQSKIPKADMSTRPQATALAS
jgi:hypothetical protein